MLKISPLLSWGLEFHINEFSDVQNGGVTHAKIHVAFVVKLVAESSIVILFPPQQIKGENQE